jgi:hypothetical protein
MNRLSHAVILFVLLLYPSVMQAEPSKKLEYLMNEPASMLDIGILKLNRELDNSDSVFNYADKSLKKIAAVAGYDFKKNKLIIDFRYKLNLYLLTTKGWNAKDVCKDQLSRVRRKFGFDDTGEMNKDSAAVLMEVLTIAPQATATPVPTETPAQPQVDMKDLARRTGFNLDAARKDGISDERILSYMKTLPADEPEVEEQESDLPSVANYFIHSGYKRTNMPKNLATEIENISYVRIEIWGGKSSARCEGGLYSEEVLFHDK